MSAQMFTYKTKKFFRETTVGAPKSAKAEDEDDALNQLEEQLKEQNIAHGMCMAEEV